MTDRCDRCKKSLRGSGFVAHSRHRDDPEDYKHVLCHDCNPAYEQESAQWDRSHPMPSPQGTAREERRALVQRWADERHAHMRDWIVSFRSS